MQGSGQISATLLAMSSKNCLRVVTQKMQSQTLFPTPKQRTCFVCFLFFSLVFLLFLLFWFVCLLCCVLAATPTGARAFDVTIFFVFVCFYFYLFSLFYLFVYHHCFCLLFVLVLRFLEANGVDTSSWHCMYWHKLLT